MQLTKKFQKLIPYGTELIIQVSSKKGLKVKIVRQFENNFSADQWFKKRELYLRNAFRNLEVLCDNVRLKK